MSMPKVNARCIGRIAAAGRISEDQAQLIMDQVFDKGDRDREAGVQDAYRKAAAEAAAKKRIEALTERADALRNAKIRADRIKEVDAGHLVKGRRQNTANNIVGTLVWRPDTPSAINAESRGRERLEGMVTGLDRKLETEGVSKIAMSGQVDADVAKELYHLRQLGPQQPQGVTGSKTAKAIADAIFPVVEEARRLLNAAGARIADAMDYIAHTAHDPIKIRGAAGAGASTYEAFRAWWGKTKPLLADKTFDDVYSRPDETWDQAVDRFGRGVYEALVTGVHKTPDGRGIGLMTEPEFTPPAFEGTRNLAQKHSHARVLFWKDAESWHTYASQYAIGNTLLETIYHTLDQAARHSALMDIWGTNPSANINLVWRSLVEKYRADTDAVNAFNKRKNFVDNLVANIDGRANMPLNEMWASLGRATRTWLSASMLGGVGVTHFASIWPTVISEMSHHGINRVEAAKNMLEALRGGTTKTEDLKSLDAELRSFHTGMIQDMMAKWQVEDSVPGKISTLASKFMKWTGIHYIFNNTQAGVRRMLANNLARNVEKPFAELDPRLQNILSRYEIRAPEWDLLRKVDGLKKVDGLAYLTPKDALRIDPAQAEAYLRSKGRLGARPQAPAQGSLLGSTTDPQKLYDEAAAKEHTKLQGELADRIGQYYSDAAAHSTVTAGVRERAILLQGMRPGSFGGELARFVAQFKSWPLAAWDQQMRRDFYQSVNGKEYAFQLGALIGLSTIGGAMRMVINDAMVGNPQRNYAEPRTLMAALAQGGGLGILGDYLFGETSRLGGGLVNTIGGPAFADADSFIQIFNRFRDDVAGKSTHKNGQYSDLWPDLAHFAVRHIPFANLVYLKGALDYMMWYHMYEAVSPGWWERSNRRLEKERGRPMLGYSPGAGVPWGVPGVILRPPGGPTSGLLSGLAH